MHWHARAECAPGRRTVRCQFPQFNELRLSGHGPVGPGLRPVLGASERGAGGAAGRAPIRRRLKFRQDGGRAEESRAMRAWAPALCRPAGGSGTAGAAGGCSGSPRPPFLSSPSSRESRLPPLLSRRPQGATRKQACLWKLALLYSTRGRGPHIQPLSPPRPPPRPPAPAWEGTTPKRPSLVEAW